MAVGRRTLMASPDDAGTMLRLVLWCVGVCTATTYNTTTVANNFGGPSDMGVGVIMAIMWCTVVACVAVCVCGRRHWLRTRRWMCRDAECDGCLQTYTCCLSCLCSSATDRWCNCCDECVVDEGEADSIDAAKAAAGTSCCCLSVGKPLDDESTHNVAHTEPSVGAAEMAHRPRWLIVRDGSSSRTYGASERGSGGGATGHTAVVFF